MFSTIWRHRINRRKQSRKNLFGFGRKATRPRNVTAAHGGIAARAGHGSRSKGSSYRGHRVTPTSSGWSTSIDPGSVFDSKTDAQRFIRAWSKRNPRKKRNDIIDDAVGAAVGVTGKIYEGLSVPYEVTMQAVKTGLQAKDTAKKALGLNPKRKRKVNPIVSASQYGLMQAAASGVARIKGISQSVAQEMIEGTPAKKRSQFAAELATRRNPADSAEHLYEKFHGKPSEEVITLTEEVHEHEHLTTLGHLISVVVDTPTGIEAAITFAGNKVTEDTPYLCSSEDGKQLYIEGGNQELDLKALGMNSNEWVKDRMVIGEFSPPRGKRKWNLEYRTGKKWDHFEPIDYQHDLGEIENRQERKTAPVLEYDPRNKKLFVAGGEYVIRQPVFGLSPGIEN